MQKVCWLFCVLYMPLWFTSGIISSVEGIWLDVLLTRPLIISHNYLTIIYAACSIQAGRFFIGQINNAKSMSPAVSSGEEHGLLSRTAAGNRACMLWCVFFKLTADQVVGSSQVISLGRRSKYMWRQNFGTILNPDASFTFLSLIYCTRISTILGTLMKYGFLKNVTTKNSETKPWTITCSQLIIFWVSDPREKILFSFMINYCNQELCF